jgi:predicted nucleotidyltransferase
MAKRMHRTNNKAFINLEVSNIFLFLRYNQIYGLMKKETVLRKLAELKTPLSQFGVTKVGLFGSTVRGENKLGSDIDVLIDFQSEKETFQNFMAVCDMLENFFKRQKLDIVTIKGLSPYVGQQILREVEYV